MDITGKTKVAALLGHPVAHSFSPPMHNAAFRELGLEACYVAFDVMPEALGAAIRGLRALNVLGANITVPHKENVIPHLDEVDEEARFIGAVNTITNNRGTLKGYNTDGRGFMRSLSEEGITVRNKRVYIAGTGGASRAVSYYISQQALKLSLFDPDTEKAEKLVWDLKGIRGNIELLSTAPTSYEAFDVLINATPLGIKPEDPCAMDISEITPAHSVIDLIYHETRLLREALEKGAARSLSGLGMLHWQGVLAFELWTGQEPPSALMRQVLLKRLGSR